ncbi:MAG: MBL fold metallo-hydrolase [Gammaproteobacteria bacterium]|nr:MBL fold metallo-hydrolase [Gammaproteobacteria bacterium]
MRIANKYTARKLIYKMAVILLSGLMISGCSKNGYLEKEQMILSAYVDATVEMKLHKVSEHVYYVRGVPGVATDNQGFISNAGFVVTSEGVVVYDALGTPSLAKKLIKSIRTVTDQPIKIVVVGHYHADHIYGLQVFKELGAEIWAPTGYEAYLDSPFAAERLEERQFSLEPWVNENTVLISPDKVITASQKFRLGDTQFIMSLLGSAHSQADMTLYMENEKVLFSGDIIFEGRVPFLGNANTKNWLATLIKFETDNVSALIPGHGPHAKNPAEAITLTRHYLQTVRQTMADAVENLQPFDEAYSEADWSEFEKLPAFAAAHRRNVYQVYLSIEQEQFSK